MSTTTEQTINSSSWTQVTIGAATSMVITNETSNDIAYAFGVSEPTIGGHTLDRKFDNIIEAITEDIWIKVSSGLSGRISITKFGV